MSSHNFASLKISLNIIGKSLNTMSFYYIQVIFTVGNLLVHHRSPTLWNKTAPWIESPMWPLFSPEPCLVSLLLAEWRGRSLKNQWEERNHIMRWGGLFFFFFVTINNNCALPITGEVIIYRISKINLKNRFFSIANVVDKPCAAGGKK